MRVKLLEAFAAALLSPDFVFVPAADLSWLAALAASAFTPVDVLLPVAALSPLADLASDALALLDDLAAVPFSVADALASGALLAAS